MKKEFSIHLFITGIRKEFPTLGPDELTKKVLTQLPTEHEREALEQALRTVVVTQISNGPSRGDRPFLVPSRGAHHEQSGRDSTRSRKLSAIRGRMEENLEKPFFVLPGGKQWIPFGDVSVDDLIRGIKTDQRRVGALTDSITAKEEWIALMVKHGVRRIRDLPESVLRERLEQGRAA